MTDVGAPSGAAGALPDAARPRLPAAGVVPRGAAPAVTVPGGRLGPFELGRVLGRGSGTVVHLAHHRDHPGLDLALKVATGEDEASRHTATATFRREAALLAGIGHRGLPTVHEVGVVDGRPFLAMEHIDGIPLTQVLEAGPLDEATLVATATDVAEVLAAAHRHGVVHRDIKPANLLVTPGGRTRVIDVGLAAWTGGEAGRSIAGTFVYSSPEQTGMYARDVDGRADLYSLGVVLYECAAGTPPFLADDVAELLHQHATVPPPSLAEQRPDLRPEIVALIERMLAKDADDRVPSAVELLDQLVTLRRAGRDDPPIRPTALTPQRAATLLSRRDELELLVTRCEQVTTTSFALITGGFGSGRNELARALVDRALAVGRTAASGSGRGEGAPLAPFREILLAHLRRLDELQDDERSAALDRLRGALGGGGAILRRMVPSLAETLEPGSAQAPAGGGAYREEDLVTAGVDLLEGLARAEGGLVLAITDAHDLDRLSRRVLRRLVASAADVPLAIVLGVPDDAPDEVAQLTTELGDLLVLRIDLAPVDIDTAVRVVTAELSGAYVPPELAGVILNRSGRGPVAIVEYVRAIVDAGAVRPHWGTWQLDPDELADLDLPEDVQDLLVSRIDGSAADVRRLMTHAAVQGTWFEPTLVAVTADVDVATVERVIATASAARLVQRTSDGVAFVHEEVRSRLLASADPDAIAATHAALADAITARGAPGTRGQVAHHRIAAGLERDPATVHADCLAAAEEALEQRLDSHAFELLEHAAEAAHAAGILLPGTFHHLAAVTAFRIGAFERAREHTELALAGLQTPLERARALETLARVHAANHDADGAFRHVHDALADIGRPLPRSRWVLAVTSLIRLFVGGLRLLTGRSPRPGARRQLDEVETDLLGVAASAGAGSLRNDLVAAYQARALLPASRLPPGERRALAVGGVALVIYHVGLRRLARRLFTLARQEAHATELPGGLAAIAVMEGVAGAREGDPTALAAALDEHGRWLDAGMRTTWTVLLTALLIGDGHVAQAERWVSRARHRGEATDEVNDSVAIRLLEAAVEALRGRVTRAVRIQEQVQARHAEVGPTRDARLFLAWTALQVAGEVGEDGPEVDAALRELEAIGLPPANVTAGWIRRAIAEIHLARATRATGWARRRALWRVAIEVRRARRNGSDHLDAVLDAVAARRAHLLGRHRAVARLLDRASRRAREQDQPLVLHDVALLRARILRDQGAAAGARQQARVALVLATECGWDRRARAVREEFGLDDRGGPGRAGPDGSGTSRRLDEVQATRRLEALQEVSAAAATVLDPDRVVDIALGVISRLLSAERAFVFAVDQDGQLVPATGRDHRGEVITELTGYSRSLVDRVHATGQPLIVTGTEEGEALGSRSTVAHGLRSILIAPIEVQGRRSGVLYLDSRVARGIFTPDDLGLLAALGSQVAAAQETARAAQLEVSVEAARQQRDLAERLRRAMVHLTGTLDPEEVLVRALDLAVDGSGSDRGCLIRPAGDHHDLVALREPGAEARRTGPRPLDTPDLGHPEDRPRVGTGPLGGDLGRALGDPASWVTIPLGTEGAGRGMIVVGTDRADAYDEVTVDVAATLTEQTLAAHQTASLFAEVERLATRDTLTGIANRGHFWHLAGSRIAATSAARSVLMLDIDRFKAINDTHGHAIGDAVLREVADRLVAAIGPADIIARYGGEEFVALLAPDVDGAAMAERLRAAVGSTPVATTAGPIEVTISVGVAVLAPPGDLDEALVRADAALYRSKRDGRDRVSLDEPPGSGTTRRR